jgi:hypothetical protein
MHRGNMFQQELDFFKENQETLVGQYKGKILVITGNTIFGVFNTNLEAYNEALKKLKLGTFMIQPCEPGTEAYTVTISTLGVISYSG